MDEGRKQHFDTCAKFKMVILSGIFFCENAYNCMIQKYCFHINAKKTCICGFCNMP